MVDYRIETFLTLYETLNYHRTGEILQLSQPAVSRQIHTLEQEYGCRLFLYDGRRLTRTAAADRVAQYARSAVYNEKKMREELAAPTARTVRIGATKTIGEFVIGDPLSRYLRETEGNLFVMVDNTENLLHQLEHGGLEFALVEGAFDKERYGHILYRYAPFVGMCHKSHPFAGKRVRIEDLAGETVILREQGSGTRAILEHTLADYGYSLSLFKRVICASSFSLVARFVEENAGITFAYSAVGERREEITFFHLDCLPERHEFNLVYMRGACIDPVLLGFFQQEGNSIPF